MKVPFWLGWFSVCFGLWVLLVFKTEFAELVAGALAAAVAATGAELVRARGYAPFAPRLMWSFALRRLPREIIFDTWRMTVVLVRALIRRERVSGCFRFISFSPGSQDDPHAKARWAAAEWLGSVSPNTYVIGIDREHEVAVVHQLIRDDPPPELRPEA